MIGEAFDVALFAWLVIAWFLVMGLAFCGVLIVGLAFFERRRELAKAKIEALRGWHDHRNRRALRAVPPPPVAPRSNRKVTP